MTFVFYMLMKNKTGFGKGTFYVLVGAMLYTAPTTLLKIVFLTIVIDQKKLLMLLNTTHLAVTCDP
jgi:hypothetical protein